MFGIVLVVIYHCFGVCSYKNAVFWKMEDDWEEVGIQSIFKEGRIYWQAVLAMKVLRRPILNGRGVHIPVAGRD